MRFGSQGARDFYKSLGIGAVIRAYYQQQVRIRCHVLDCYLPIFGGVTNILSGRALDVREFLAQSRDDVASLIEAEVNWKKLEGGGTKFTLSKEKSAVSADAQTES